MKAWSLANSPRGHENMRWNKGGIRNHMCSVYCCYRELFWKKVCPVGQLMFFTDNLGTLLFLEAERFKFYWLTTCFSASLRCVSCQTRIMSRSWLHLEAKGILYKHQKNSKTPWGRHWKTQASPVLSTSWLNHRAHGRPRQVQLLSRKEETQAFSWFLPERHTLWDLEVLLSFFLNLEVSFACSTSSCWDIVMCACWSNK